MTFKIKKYDGSNIYSIEESVRKEYRRCEAAKLFEEAHEKADDMTVKTLVIPSSVESPPLSCPPSIPPLHPLGLKIKASGIKGESSPPLSQCEGETSTGTKVLPSALFVQACCSSNRL